MKYQLKHGNQNSLKKAKVGNKLIYNINLLSYL